MHTRAIETRYKGYRFRSRLEARWAVFFDALGLKWEYEPEGFELPGGVRYLPDFLLYDVTGKGARNAYAEIKALPSDDSKAKLLSNTPVVRHLWLDDEGRQVEEFESPLVLLLDGVPDERYYPLFSTGKILLRGAFDRPEGGPPAFYKTGVDTPPGAKPSLGASALGAIYAARGARFEHGEAGAR